MAKLNSSETKIIDQIAAWKAESPSFINRATEFVSRPISWLTDKLTPEDIKASIGGMTEKVVEKLQDISKWTVDPQEVLNETKEFEIEAKSIADLKKASIHDLDHIAEKFITTNTRMATISGAGTGLVGWPGLIADLPALFTIGMRSICHISLTYGFDPKGEHQTPEDQAFETEYMMRVFKIATASDKIQKQRGLSELKDFETGRYHKVGGELAGDFTTKQVSKSATFNISQRIIREIVEQTISKKAAALVPGLGAIFSAGFNYVYLQDVGETAFMLYRERFLLDKQGRRKVISVEIE